MKKNITNKRTTRLIKKRLKTPLARRSFLKGLVATVGTAAVSTPTKTAKAFSFAEYFQKHYHELTEEDKKKIFERIEHETKKEYGVDVKVTDPQPMEGVRFAYALNLSKCNGSRFCVEACQKENNTERSFAYIKVIELDHRSFNLEEGSMYYEGEIPKEGKFYLPVQCHQCENPPCIRSCPIKATWKEEDGIVVVDYNWCIGCRYCQAACPYEARRFNFKKPSVPKDEINPNQAYLSNRIRPRGVVEKCTFCLQRSRNGRYPACLEACPTGARKFGNILDPKSEISYVLKYMNCFVLKEELNTVPRFFYFFG